MNDSGHRVAYPDDDFQAASWCSALRAAAEYPPIAAAFEEFSGHPVFPPPPRNGLERMVDEACGLHKAWAEEFMEWFNRNIWGEDLFGVERCPGFPCALIREDGNAGDEKTCSECGRHWRWDADPKDPGWELTEKGGLTWAKSLT